MKILLTLTYKHDEREMIEKCSVQYFNIILFRFQTFQNKFQPIDQSFIEWVLISFKLKWWLHCEICPNLFQREAKTLFIAPFKWKLPFHGGPLHQPATHSRQHSVLHFTAFQVGWSVMMWLYCKGLLKSFLWKQHLVPLQYFMAEKTHEWRHNYH